MPKSITSKQLNQLFPFEFLFDLNVAFINEDVEYMFILPSFNDAWQREQVGRLYTTAEMHKDYHMRIENNETYYAVGDDPDHKGSNILDIHPLGEMVLLEPVQKVTRDGARRDTDTKAEERISTLCVQIYNEQDEPVLSKDVSEETINALPAMKWDDDNLAIAILHFSETEEHPNIEGASLQILKLPERIAEKWFEEAVSEPIDETEFEAIENEVQRDEAE